MKITRKINLNVKETVERSVSGNSDFHFYVDELSSNNYMSTYSGMADEILDWSLQLATIRILKRSYLSLNMEESVKISRQMTSITFWNSNLPTLGLRSKDAKLLLEQPLKGDAAKLRILQNSVQQKEIESICL